MTIQLSRQQRRQMQRLADRVDLVSQADRRFFQRFPHRDHRVRLASQPEVEQHTILEGKSWMPAGCRLYICVKQIAPGVRIRAFLWAPADRETDVSEEIASAVYEAAATSRTRQIEAQLREAAKAR